MTKPKNDWPPAKVTDPWLAKWKWSPDPTRNRVALGQSNLEASISKMGDVTFSVRQHVPGLGRPRKALKPFFDKETFTIEDAIIKAKKLRNDWRDKADGKLVVDPDAIPLMTDFIDQWEKAVAPGDDPIASPDGKGLQKRWKDLKPAIRGMYAPLMQLKVSEIVRLQQITDCQTAYLNKRERERGKRPTSTVRNVCNAFKRICEYGVALGYMKADAIFKLKAGVSKKKRRRIVTPWEWQQAAPALDALPNGYGLFPRFLITTAARFSMPFTMRWRDLKEVNAGTLDAPRMLTTWCVPAEHMKMGYLAIFPIVDDAQRILDELKAMAGGKPDRDALVFPDVIREAWEGNRTYWQKRIYKASGTKHWHRHDLRRTAATLLKSFGADTGAIKRLLAHSEDEGDSERGDSTDHYVLLDDDTMPQLAELADHLIKLHAMLRDIEAGRVTRDLKNLYNKLAGSKKVAEMFHAFPHLDPHTMVEVVPGKEQPTAEVRELRPVRA